MQRMREKGEVGRDEVEQEDVGLHPEVPLQQQQQAEEEEEGYASSSRRTSWQRPQGQSREGQEAAMDAAKTAGEAVGENLGVHQQGHRRSTTASKKQRDRNPYG